MLSFRSFLYLSLATAGVHAWWPFSSPTPTPVPATPAADVTPVDASPAAPWKAGVSASIDAKLFQGNLNTLLGEVLLSLIKKEFVADEFDQDGPGASPVLEKSVQDFEEETVDLKAIISTLPGMTPALSVFFSTAKLEKGQILAQVGESESQPRRTRPCFNLFGELG